MKSKLLWDGPSLFYDGPAEKTDGEAAPHVEGADDKAAPRAEEADDKVATRRRERNRLWAVFGVSFALAFVCVTIASRSSFLYDFNDWVDTNWYLSVGHGMVEGMVPYKDLFEQKGLLVYFLFALDYLIFGNQFWGIYIAEIIIGTLYLFCCFKTLKLFMSYRRSLLYLCGVAALTYTAAGQQLNGGCVEEYCLPMLAYGVYTFFAYVKSGGEKVPLYRVALCGLYAGLIFWIKYTVLAFYLVFAVCLFTDRCIKHDVKSGFIYAAVFIAAFAVPAIPCLAYLGVNDAIPDMVEDYLYRNIFSYGGTGGFAYGLLRRLRNILYNSYFYVIAVVSAVYVYIKSNRSVYGIYYIVIVAFVIFIQIVAGRHLQYYFTIVIFLTVGLKPTIELIGWLFGNAAAHIKARRAKKRGDIHEQTPVAEVQNTGFSAFVARKIRVGANVHTCALCAVVVAVFVLLFGTTTPAIFVQLEYTQGEVAQVIEERSGDDAVLLSYKIDDKGFYTAYDQAPRFKYFALNDFSRESFPELYDEQERYVREGLADYVVTTPEYAEEDSAIFAEGGYEIIGEFERLYMKSNISWYTQYFVLFEKVVG